jgi:hypothetical protein
MYFLLPLVRFRGAGDVASEHLHTLAQAYIIVRDEAISPELIHFSMYTYNDLLVPTLRRSGGPLGRTFERFWHGLGGRTFILGGYLHSRHSPGIRLTLHRGGTEGRTRVRLEGIPNPAARRIARRAGLKLLRHARDLRAVPLLPFIRFFPPGKGFHCGGSFPMQAVPQPGRSDRLGRPYGFSSVHLVDASSFPSIPATLITLPIMANAHRIASAAVES